MHHFTATLEIIGINPFVAVPVEILAALFTQAGTDKGPVPVAGTVNGMLYRQNLVRYKGAWRLYINTSMLKASPKRVGEAISITIAFDPEDRTIAPPPELLAALRNSPGAEAVFNALPPSRRKEISRYIAALKGADSIERNVARAIGFLLGKNRFIGRDKP